MRKICIIALLLGIVQGAMATAYSYYISEWNGAGTLTYKGANTEPNGTNQWNVMTMNAYNDYASFTSQVTTVVFDASFVEARPTSCYAWFQDFNNLESIVGLFYLNTSEVTTLEYMFAGCSTLTELNLSYFNTTNVTTMHGMFSGCSSLTTIYIGDGWITTEVNQYEMFTDCNSLTGDIDGKYTSDDVYWQGNVAQDFYDVSGTTVTIHNIGEMALLAQRVKNGNTYSGYTFLLAKDLAYDDTENNYTAIGTSTYSFAGTFDGQGHIICGIYINAEHSQGLFGYAGGATIKDLTLTASTINSSNNASAAGIVGNVVGNNGIAVINCHVTSSVTISSGNNSAGIVGATDIGTINITGCSSGATISTRNNSCVGGIIGKCGNEGNGSNSTFVNIAGCLYYGTSLTGSTEMTGGIVGYYYTTYGSIAGQSTVNLSDNFYTYPDVSVKGVGKWKKSNSNYTDETNLFDIIENKGAIRVRSVTTQADIDDMEGLRNDVSYTSDIAYHNRGVKYAGSSYSHVLALENNADNTDVIAAYAGQTFDVKLRGRRFYKDDSWNTVCLPFDLPNFNGTVFKSETGCNCYLREMDVERAYHLKDKTTGEYDYSVSYKTGVNVKNGKSRLYLFFKDNNLSFTAGKPFIVKWDKPEGYNASTAASFDIFNPIFNNVTIVNSSPVSVTSSDGTVTFKSIYAPESFDEANRSILFVGAANTLYYPSGAGTVSLKSFRAYFQLNGVQMAGDPDSGAGDEEFIPEGGGSVKPFVLDIEYDDVTSIGNVRSKMADGRGDVWYSLDGKCLNGIPAQKGIYIHNGRKEVLK